MHNGIKIGVLIPTRGDRPVFLKQAKHLLNKQTIAPDLIEIFDEKPKTSDIDIMYRYKTGCDRLFKNGADVVLFWEDDDWYSNRYIEIMMASWDNARRPAIFGIGSTIYYHIKTLQYLKINHSGRASMMATMVTKEILSVAWGRPTDAYVDILLWQQIKGRTFIPHEPICLGIKHGIGLTGGGGHDAENFAHYQQIDPEKTFLKSIVGSDFKFYDEFVI